VEDKILLSNTTVSQVHAVISGFSSRYRNYRSNDLPGVWECRKGKCNGEIIQLQLIDRIYEPPRGIKTSESPILHIFLAEDGDNVSLTYYIRWKLSVTILYLLYCVVTLSMLSISLFWLFSQYFAEGGIMLACSLILAGIAVVWLFRECTHNVFIKRIFLEILCKNFDIKERRRSA